MDQKKNDVIAKTLPGIFFEQSKKFVENPLFWSKKDCYWEGVSWQDASAQVKKLASLLMVCGISKGDRVLIASEIRPEWSISDLAINVYWSYCCSSLYI